MVAYTSLREILTNILETHHSFYFPSLEGGGGGGCKRISTIWREEGLGFLVIVIINFTSRLLFDLPFSCRLKDIKSIFIFHLFF